MTRLIILFIVMTPIYLFPNDLILVNKYESNLLMNPLQIKINKNNIYIFDSEGDKPFYIFDKNNGKFIKTFGDWGRGPGEVIKYGSLARIIGFTQNKIIVTDPVGKKYIEFDERGNFVKEYRFPDFIRTSLNTILTDQRKIMLSGFGPEKSFGITYQLNEDLTINKASKKFLGIYDEIPELINCRNNPLLKQGPICYDYEGNIFLTFHF